MQKDLKLFYIAKVFASASFWLTIIVAFFNTKDITNAQGFQLISFYSIMIAILEFPTGIISDKYSHKISLFLGYLLTGIAMIIMVYTYSYISIFISLFILALGQSLASGSDTAVLYNLSNNYKKDSANLGTLLIIVSVIAITLGGILGNIYLFIPVFLSGLSYLIATGLVLFVRTKKASNKNNDWNNNLKMFSSIHEIIANKSLVYLLLLVGIIVGILISTKWFYNPIFENLSINVNLWGILISLFVLSKGIGTYLYKIIDISYYKLLVLFALGILFFSFGYLGLLSFILLSISGIYLNIKVDNDVNNTILDDNRAAINSLKSLLIRAFSFLFLFITPIFIEKLNMDYLFYSVSLFVLAFGIIIIHFYNKNVGKN